LGWICKISGLLYGQKNYFKVPTFDQNDIVDPLPPWRSHIIMVNSYEEASKQILAGAKILLSWLLLALSWA